MVAVEAGTRARVLDRLRLGDIAFRHITRAAAIGVLLLLSGVIVSLIQGSLPALQDFRLRIPHHRTMESGHREIRCSRADLRHARHFVYRHADRGAGRADDRFLSDRTLPAMAAAADRHRHRTARRHSQHHLRHLGSFHFRSVFAGHVAAVPDQNARRSARHRAAFCRAALRHRHADGGIDPGHHGAAVRDVDLARRVRGRSAGAQGGGLRHRLHDLGGRAQHRAALRAGRRDRRRDARARPGARRNHGRDLRDRQRAQDFRVAARSRAPRFPPPSPTSSPKRSAISTRPR